MEAKSSVPRPGGGATSISTSPAPAPAPATDDMSSRATMPWLSTSASRSSLASVGTRNSRSA